MPIRVLLADDSPVMLSAIRKTLDQEPRIEVVGEASTFAETMRMIADFKPEALILDLHLPEKGDFTPAFVNSQLVSVDCVVAISFSNDDEAKNLSETYGAAVLLDKMNLYSELIPAIMECCGRQDAANRFTASA